MRRGSRGFGRLCPDLTGRPVHFRGRRLSTEFGQPEHQILQNTKYDLCYYNFRTNEHEADQNVSEENESLKKSRKRSANDTIIRFLKAQITKLQTEMQAAQYKIKKQVYLHFI